MFYTHRMLITLMAGDHHTRFCDSIRRGQSPTVKTLSNANYHFIKNDEKMIINSTVTKV